MATAAENKVVPIEELDTARKVIGKILKMRKLLRIYPKSNTVYMDNLENTYAAFKDFFNYKDKLTLRFGRNDIYYNSESVYNNPQKQDNLALLFFKDGMQEITFRNTVTRDEFEDFLEIIAADFCKEVVEDDLVTLFWQRDFTNIEYLAEDIMLTEEEVNELNTINELKDGPSDPPDFKRAYHDSFEENGIPLSVPLFSLTADDHKQLLIALENDRKDKLPKYFNMLFDIYYSVDRSVEYEGIVYFFMKSIEYSIKNGNYRLITDVLIKLKKIIGNKNTNPKMRKSAINILLFVSGTKMIGIIGDLLEKEGKTDEEDFQKYIYVLDQNAIFPLINLLSDLKSVYARRMITDALASLILKDTPKLKTANKEISRLLKELNHPDWYVVNKIIYILSLIGNASVIEYIKKTVKHADIRVRMEAVKVLGEIGRDNVLGTIQECLDDEDIKVRKASLAALGNIATESAKNMIMQQISKSLFIEKELAEKKEHFRTLARWNDKKIYDFCVRMVRRKSFLNRSAQYETRVCAVYGLGLMGRKDALPVLNKCKSHGSGLLYDISDEAIRRIESGG